eukprot:4002187-Prymnesium_polylepis.2
MWPPSAATVSPPSAALHRSQSSRRRIARRSPATLDCPRLCLWLPPADPPCAVERRCFARQPGVDRVACYSRAGGPSYALQPGWRAALCVTPTGDVTLHGVERCIEWFAGSGRLVFALKKQQGWDECADADRNVDAVEWAEHEEQAESCIFRSDEFEEVDRGSFFHEKPYDWHFSID